MEEQGRNEEGEQGIKWTGEKDTRIKEEHGGKKDWDREQRTEMQVIRLGEQVIQ